MNTDTFKTGGTLRIIKTDCVIMHYVRLPIIDTNVRFLYRFEVPMQTVWTVGKISCFCKTRANKIKDNRIDVKFVPKESIEEFAINTWNDAIIGNLGPDQELPEEAKWLKIDKAKAVECEIVPK